MDYRRTSLVVNRQKVVSTNSHIYTTFAGAGSCRNTNGILPESPTMWWDEERIETTVTRPFVIANLRPDEQIRLDEPLGFGDGLTDDTYIEWIELKAKRIFLILVDLGVPDQIFGVIDDSWDDDDLPIPFDQVERLRLTYERDERIEKRFFQRQFNYLLRTIQKGEQLVYEEDEVVPLESAEKRPVGAVTGLTHSSVDKVHLPSRPDDIFVRRRIPLGKTLGRMPKEEFLSGIEAMKVTEHDHLTSLWASYIHQDYGFLLITPVNDISLKSFLTVTPQSFKILAKEDRRMLVLNWIHCLADALSFLHSQGLSHGNIKPSNIMLDVDNHIFFADSSIFSKTNLEGEKSGFDKETYDYSAPEKAPKPPVPAPIYLSNVRSTTRATAARASSVPSQKSIAASSSTDTASINTSSANSTSNASFSSTRASKHDPQKSDIFSLGSIFLEILTFLLKRASRNFSSFRSSKNKTPGRGGGLPDSSFHKNMGQVQSWMGMLEKDASKKEDKLFRGVKNILVLVDSMMTIDPSERPSAKDIQEKLFVILEENCGMGKGGKGTAGTGESRGRIHCETRNREVRSMSGGIASLNFGFDEMRLASQRAAAAACASVAPISTLSGNIDAGTTAIYDPDRVLISPVAGGRGGFGEWRDRGGKNEMAVRGGKGRGRVDQDDRASVTTSRSRSTEGKSRSGSGSLGDRQKIKPKAKPWQAPVYAEISWG